ncbi:PAS domain-containing sensor histidine kinase [candidate division KSB1 bacterium]
MFKKIPFFWKLSTAFIIVSVLVLFAGSLLDRVNYLESSRILRISITVSIVIFLSCISAWLIIRLCIMRSIRRLAEGMHELAGKKFDFRLDENGKDEFSSLASSFNDIAVLFSFFQAELNKARDYLENVLESTADIIITVNAMGKILTINTGAEEALGYQRSDVIGKPIEMIFADPREREIALERLKDANSVVNYEARFLTKSGEVRDVLLTLSRMRNPSGEIVGTIGISKDITREKRFQKQLIQSQRLAAIGEVFTGVQHSLKNMLNTCKGGAYMVRTGLGKDNQTMLKEGWEIVQEGIERMTDMSRDMLKYVKEWKPKIEEVDLAQALADIDLVVRKNARDKGIEFDLDISKELPPVKCDSGMIHTALMDIVSNAIDACLWKDYKNDEVPKVSLKAYLNNGDQNAILEVKDNGCGMTEDVKTRIFAPFYSTKSKSGTGLGLAITLRMIDAHNGSIDVESEPGIGTEFRIAIPIDANK